LFYEETNGKETELVGKSRRVLGLLYLYAGDGEKAQKELESSFYIYKNLKGEDCKECIGIKDEIEHYL